MLAGTFSAELDWGLLVVADSGSDYQVPDFSGDRDEEPEPYVGKHDVIVIRVANGPEKPLVARVWVGDYEVERRGTVRLGATTIALRTGCLVLSDVLQELSLSIAIPAGQYNMEINADNSVEPEVIDLVIFGGTDVGQPKN